MTPWRDLPPLAALRAFAAFAEQGNVTDAGARIGVTHAAVSQQIRALEQHLGLPLVVRGGRNLVLTPQGRRLADAALAGFAEMARTVRDLTGAEADRPLQITTTPSFAAGWLMPRLADFRLRHPDIDLVIDPTPKLREIGAEGADIGLRYGDGTWRGLESRLVVSTPIVVVAAPSLIGDRRVTGVADLWDLPWLQELGTTETSAFLDQHGVQRSVHHGLTSLPGDLMLAFARNGQGIAVVARAFVETDVAAGRLVVLHEDAEREGYFVVTRPGVLRAPATAFVKWVIRQGAADQG